MSSTGFALARNRFRCLPCSFMDSWLQSGLSYLHIRLCTSDYDSARTEAAVLSFVTANNKTNMQNDEAICQCFKFLNCAPKKRPILKAGHLQIDVGLAACCHFIL